MPMLMVLTTGQSKDSFVLLVVVARVVQVVADSCSYHDG